MKPLLKVTLAALLGTTLLPATGSGFQETNTNPAADIDDVDIDSADDDPFTDMGAEVDADTTNPDSPEITDAVAPIDDDDDIDVNLVNNSSGDSVSQPEPISDDRIVEAPAAVAMPDQNTSDDIDEDSTGSNIPEVSELEDDDEDG